MTLANDQATEYELNVLARIETMESMIVGWGRRHLSINGRMMVAKSFILSQIVFPAQFTSICNKEIKKIERLVYSYVNGARNLYGPERIARRYLKASKINGGINGIDVNSFLTAIALRQFGKAMSMSRALRSLQSSLITIKDDIGSLTLRISKAGLVSFCRDNPMPDLTQLELISSARVSSLLKYDSAAARIANQYGIATLFDIQDSRERGRIPRNRINLIIKSLPTSIARLIRAGNVVNVQDKHMLITPLEFIDLESSTTRLIRNSLLAQKNPDLHVDLNRIHRRIDLPAYGSIEFSELYRNIWKMKQPTLRAIRLKLCFKDVYANERRYRFGIADSPNCQVCNQVETVDHQLLECANANRLWLIYYQCTGVVINSLKDIVTCSGPIEAEVLKSSIIKLLLQIDRSKNLTNKGAAQLCAYFLRIESTVNSSHRIPCMNLVVKLNATS